MKDLNELAAFSAVVTHGGFTSAAQALGLQKSTLSRMVSRLEQRLDAPLLVRTSRKLAVTDTGRALHDRVTEGLRLLSSAESVATGELERPVGLVRLSAMPDFAAIWIAPAVTAFTRLHPRVQIELVLTTRVVDLVAERVDLAIRSGPLPDSSLVAQRVGQARRYIVAAPGYLKRRGLPRTQADLAGHDCLAYRATDGVATWRVVEDGRARGLKVAARLAADDFDILRGWACAGAGITMLPGFICQSDMKAGRLVPVLDHLVRDASPLFLVHPEGRHLSAAVRAFRDFLVARLRGDKQTRPRTTPAK